MIAFPYSSKTLARLADAIDSGYTDSKMGLLFLDAQVDQWAPDNAKNKLDRAMQLLVEMRTVNTTQSADGFRELARLVLARGKPPSASFSPPEAAPWYPQLRDALAADGWDFDEQTDKLVPIVPAVSMSAEFSALEQALNARGFGTAAGHYSQAVDAFGDGKWASANGQLRACFEETVTQLGAVPPSSHGGRIQKAFDNLGLAGKLKPDEDEFGKRLWKQLHPNGAHPGLSDEDEARFRLLTLTGYLRYLVARA